MTNGTVKPDCASSLLRVANSALETGNPPQIIANSEPWTRNKRESLPSTQLQYRQNTTSTNNITSHSETISLQKNVTIYKTNLNFTSNSTTKVNVNMSNFLLMAKSYITQSARHVIQNNKPSDKGNVIENSELSNKNLPQKMFDNNVKTTENINNILLRQLEEISLKDLLDYSKEQNINVPNHYNIDSSDEEQGNVNTETTPFDTVFSEKGSHTLEETDLNNTANMNSKNVVEDTYHRKEQEHTTTLPLSKGGSEKELDKIRLKKLMKSNIQHSVQNYHESLRENSNTKSNDDSRTKADGMEHFGAATLADSLSTDVGRDKRDTNTTAVSAEKRSVNEVNNDEHICAHPEYIVFTWVLCLVALATSLKLYYLVKTALAFVMVTIYTLLILVAYRPVFDNELEVMPLFTQMLVLLIAFLTMVTYHARLVEVTSRLDFLWKQQAERELADMMETRQNNTQLLKNILPDHVAKHFLAEDRQTDELYSQSRDKVGVMFASIPNFTEFYSEDINKGMECIRLLNEIIADFDELLDEPRFKNIEKVKTVGASYMAASGLNPTHKPIEDELDHVCALVDFALAMKHRLDDVNKHSFNNFHLRVGISCGPLVGGVIGARKPVFDIWGNTVNEASRMDSTGTMGQIQVPKETAMILEARGYLLQLRGMVAVKGKGEMETYYVLGRHSGRSAGFVRQPSTYNSLAAVVYGMVQARRKQTVRKVATPSSSAIGRARSQQRKAVEGTSPQGMGRLSNFSSMRVSTRSIGSNPVRRNTTRAGAGGCPTLRMHSMDPNAMRNTNNILNAIQQQQHSSAPQTPLVSEHRTCSSPVILDMKKITNGTREAASNPR